MDKDQFKKVINQIKMSDIYENSENWKARYLIPSDLTIINLLRAATNTFLDKLSLPEGLTLASLKRSHSSRPRNPIIADVSFKGGYIDAWG